MMCPPTRAPPAVPAVQPDTGADAASTSGSEWDDSLQLEDHGNKRQQQVWLIQQVGRGARVCGHALVCLALLRSDACTAGKRQQPGRKEREPRTALP